MQTFIFFLLKVNNVTGARGLGVASAIMVIIIYADGYLISTWPDYTLSVQHSICLSPSLPVPCPFVFLSHSFTHSLRDNIGLVTSWNTSRDRFRRRLGRYLFAILWDLSFLRGHIYTYGRLRRQVRLSRVLANILNSNTIIVTVVELIVRGWYMIYIQFGVKTIYGQRQQNCVHQYNTGEML